MALGECQELVPGVCFSSFPKESIAMKQAVINAFQLQLADSASSSYNLKHIHISIKTGTLGVSVSAAPRIWARGFACMWQPRSSNP